MAHALTRLREGQERFRAWRRGRPFWGGLLLAVAGIEILVAPAAQSLVLPIDLIIHSGIAGVSGTLIGLLLIGLGVLSWLQPAQNVFFGIVGLLLALVTFVTSNFGGFVIGMLLGIIGGSLVFAWGPTARAEPRRSRRKLGGKHREERVEDPDPRSEPLATVALPLALVVTLAAAPAPNVEWPWDWLFPDDEEEQSEEDPSEEPGDDTEETDPAEDPDAEPEDGEDEEGDEDGEDGEDTDEEDQDTDEGDAEACEFRVGEDGIGEDEDELLEAVLACQAAEEEGSLPEIPVDEDHGCFHGSSRTSGLTADSLTMTGARYDGVVECPTDEGMQRYIRLSMSTADLDNGELWFEDAGTRMSLDLPTLSMDGEVTMHVTRMHVRLLGIPITFTPDFPPPLLLPFMIVTDVDVDSPMAETDLMVIPDLNARHNENAA